MGRSPRSSLQVLTDNEKLNTDTAEQISWTEVTSESVRSFENW